MELWGIYLFLNVHLNRKIDGPWESIVIFNVPSKRRVPGALREKLISSVHDATDI